MGFLYTFLLVNLLVNDIHRSMVVNDIYKSRERISVVSVQHHARYAFVILIILTGALLYQFIRTCYLNYGPILINYPSYPSKKL